MNLRDLRRLETNRWASRPSDREADWRPDRLPARAAARIRALEAELKALKEKNT